jgi:uncharacterized membrane protein
MVDVVHIHPMLVHFPIVLYLVAVGLQLLALFRRGDLNADTCLSNSAFAALLLAAAAAAVAAFFGDIALDHAVALGFPAAPMETHANLGIATMTLMLLLAGVHLLARWFHWPLANGRGWGLWSISVAGVALLLLTAYHGGDLVYHIGVNVNAVTP